MNLEKLVADMMTMSVKARLWHWMTDTAQHHTTFEDFLTQNEALTDSLVESSMGNDLDVNLSKVGVVEGVSPTYSIDSARSQFKDYRATVMEMRKTLDESDKVGADELVTILDDVVELSSKTLYMLKLK